MTEAEKQILALLSKEWDLKGPPGILDVSEVVAALPLAPSDTLAALKVLFASGLTDSNSLKSAVYLTPEGYQAAQPSRSARERGSSSKGLINTPGE